MIRVTNHGSLFLLASATTAARDWLVEHTDPEATTWYAGALVVEPRYVDDIVAGARAEGLEVQ